MQRLVVLAVAAALLATACSSPRPASPLTPSRSSVPAGPQTFTVSVDGKSPSYNLAADAYFPSALKVHPGDTIQFREVWSGEPHTVTLGTAVAPLANGNFVVAWVSEQQRYENSVDIYARLFDANGNALGNEFLANSADHVCANPSLSATEEGGWVLASAPPSAGPSRLERLLRSIGEVADVVDPFDAETDPVGEQEHPTGRHGEPQS